MANQKRLIDANALSLGIKIAIKYFGNAESDWLKGYSDGLDAAKDLIEQTPTIDAVEVVRCRDCKFMIPQSHTRYCTVWNAVNGMGDDGFCNYGERKNDNGKKTD